MSRWTPTELAEHESEGKCPDGDCESCQEQAVIEKDWFYNQPCSNCNRPRFEHEFQSPHRLPKEGCSGFGE